MRARCYALHKWLKKRGIQQLEEALFVTRKGEKLKRRYINKLLQRPAKKAGIQVFAVLLILCAIPSPQTTTETAETHSAFSSF